MARPVKDTFATNMSDESFMTQLDSMEITASRLLLLRGELVVVQLEELVLVLELLRMLLDKE